MVVAWHCDPSTDRPEGHLSFGTDAWFWFSDDLTTVHCHHGSDHDGPSLRHLLLDHALPRLLAARGALVLHASGISCEGRAVLLLGASGSGKSTLALALHRQGLAHLGDDCMVVQPVPTPSCLPTYAGARLNTASRQALWPHDDQPETAPVGDHLDKRRVHVASRTEPTPLSGLLVLRGHDGPTVMSPLSGAEAVLAVVSNSFGGDLSNRHRTVQLDAIGSLCEQVPVLRLSYRQDLHNLAEVAADIAAQLA